MHRLDAHLARLARSAPRATAVVLVNDETASETTTRLTWTELDGVVDALAARLRASWRTSNDDDDDDDDDAPARVVSLCRDGVAAVVALLASSRARRSVVPLDAEAWPRARIREAARVVGCLGRDDDDDARTTPTVLCATREEIPRAMEIFGARADVVVVSDVREDRAAATADAEPAADDAADAELYVAFTSGTTGGGVKALPGSHRRLLAYAARKASVERVRHDSRVCLASNATFDVHAGDVAAALIAGAAVVVASRGLFQRDFARVLIAGAVTHVCCTPTLFSMASLRAKEAPALEVITLAGEKMTAETIEARSIHWSPYDRVGVVNADP